MFGGEKGTTIGNDILYKYDFVSNLWSAIQPSKDVPKLDSHSAVVVDSKMYVYGGYMSEQAENMRDVLAFDFESEKWEVVYRSNGKEDEP